MTVVPDVTAHAGGGMGWQDLLATFLAENVAPTRGLRGQDKLAAARRFHAALVGAELAAPGWPCDIGGLGLDAVGQIAYHRLMTASGAPAHPCPLSFIVAPTIIKHGTRAQRERWLRPLLAADELWCQGFSEPAAGSDLTALITRAVRDGDVYRVDGQKLWTTQADRADWMFALVRTGPPGPGGAGITYLCIPMTARGITVRPLRDISGAAHFAEVFLDGVEVPVENRLGAEGDGWSIARNSLGHERATAFLSDEFRYRRTVDEVLGLVRAQGYADDPAVQQQVAHAETGLRVIAAHASRALGAVLRGEDPGATGSVNRLVKSEFEQQLHALALRVLGPDAVLGNRATAAVEGGRWTYGYLMTRASTIGAGTAEIQRNTIAEQVLGLPSSRGESSEGRTPRAVPGRPLGRPEPEEADLREVLERIAAAHGDTSSRLALADEPGRGDRALWQDLVDVGVPGLAVPEADGGLGAGTAMSCAAVEEVARGLGAVPLVAHLAATAAVRAAGADTGQLAAGTTVGVVAAPRGDLGWSVDAATVEALDDGSGLRLSGVVRAVPGAPWADLLVVLARTASGPVLAAVDAGEGVEVEAAQPLDLTALLGDVILTQAPARLLAPTGDVERVLLAAESAGLLAVAADAVGVAARAVAESVHFARDRVQFGRAVGSFQAVAHPVANAYVRTEGARSLVAAAARAVDEDAADAALLVDLAAAEALDAAVQVTETALQVHGGIGFTWEHCAHLLVRRARSDEALVARAERLRARAARRQLG
jgi:acyl-CoA dehydrogenase